jgi:hypothetical protein
MPHRPFYVAIVTVIVVETVAVEVGQDLQVQQDPQGMRAILEQQVPRVLVEAQVLQVQRDLRQILERQVQLVLVELVIQVQLAQVE